MELPQALFILVCGLSLMVVLFIGVVVISSITMKRVTAFKSYCDIQFDKISKQIESTNLNTAELTGAVKELNITIKKL